MDSSSSCRPLPVVLGSTFTTYTTSSLLHPPCPRFRRPRRVLYPASQRIRPPLKEAPDRARRWLLLFSALVLLQIYNEETNGCTDPQQSQYPDPAVCQPQDGDGSLGSAQDLMRDEPLRVQSVASAPENQQECVVA